MSIAAPVELSGLEYQVDHLLLALERLKAENAELRQRLTAHHRERSYLIQQKQQAAHKIKKIITQLREELS